MAGAASAEKADEPPSPLPGQAVTADTQLKVGQTLQGYRNNKWQDATVVEVRDSGEVKLHWTGYGSEEDTVLPRTHLRILRPDP